VPQQAVALQHHEEVPAVDWLALMKDLLGSLNANLPYQHVDPFAVVLQQQYGFLPPEDPYISVSTNQVTDHPVKLIAMAFNVSLHSDSISPAMSSVLLEFVGCLYAGRQMPLALSNLVVELPACMLRLCSSPMVAKLVSLTTKDNEGVEAGKVVLTKPMYALQLHGIDGEANA
jgi:hypothetical protein